MKHSCFLVIILIGWSLVDRNVCNPCLPHNVRNVSPHKQITTSKHKSNLGWVKHELEVGGQKLLHISCEVVEFKSFHSYLNTLSFMPQRYLILDIITITLSPETQSHLWLRACKIISILPLKKIANILLLVQVYFHTTWTWLFFRYFLGLFRGGGVQVVWKYTWTRRSIFALLRAKPISRWVEPNLYVSEHFCFDNLMDAQGAPDKTAGAFMHGKQGQSSLPRDHTCPACHRHCCYGKDINSPQAIPMSHE